MKRDHKEDSIYMQHKIEEILNDLGYATDDLCINIPVPKKYRKSFHKIEHKMVELLEDMKKGA